MSEFIPAEAVIEPHAGPPGNRLYLVCSACPDTDNALMLGKRLSQGYSRGPSSREINGDVTLGILFLRSYAK